MIQLEEQASHRSVGGKKGNRSSARVLVSFMRAFPPVGDCASGILAIARGRVRDESDIVCSHRISCTRHYRRDLVQGPGDQALEILVSVRHIRTPKYQRFLNSCRIP